MVIEPVLSLMCDVSLRSGMFLDSHKHVVVFPRLKKPSLVADDDLNSNQPILSLSFISKLERKKERKEKVVARRFVRHAEQNKLYPVEQSAFRQQQHSTESAVVSWRLAESFRWSHSPRVLSLILMTMVSCWKHFSIDSQSIIFLFRGFVRT